MLFVPIFISKAATILNSILIVKTVYDFGDSKGHHNGKKEGYNNASKEYEEKFKDQEQRFSSEKEEYEDIILNYEDMILQYEEMISKLERKISTLTIEDLDKLDMLKRIFDFLKSDDVDYENTESSYSIQNSITKKAELGDPRSQYYLGKISDNDTEIAIYWLNKSAEQEYVEAQYDLGKLYLEDGSCNFVKAKCLFEQAARQKHILAQYELAKLYLRGEGVKLNYSKAKYWFEQAENQGHFGSRYFLDKHFKVNFIIFNQNPALTGLGISHSLKLE